MNSIITGLAKFLCMYFLHWITVKSHDIYILLIQIQLHALNMKEKTWKEGKNPPIYNCLGNSTQYSAQ